MTPVKVKSSHTNNYLSESKKVFSEKTTQVVSNFWFIVSIIRALMLSNRLKHKTAMCKFFS